MTEEWCRQQLANLQIKDLRTTALTEIKNQLTLLPANESDLPTNFIRSPELLDCLEDSNSEQTALACDILSICMSSLTLDETANNNVLERSLNHANPNVKALALNELSRILNTTPNTIKNMNLIISLIKCLESDETKVGTPAIDVLIKSLPNFIHIHSIKSNLEQTLKKNDIVKCRTYEIGVKIARESPKLQENVEFILQQALLDLENEDILLQLSVLEILSELPLHQHGLIYLENNGVFDKLLKKIETIDENPLAKILIPGLMKFYGNIASTHPSKIFNGYPNVITALFECLSSNDFSVLPIAFDTLGHLGRSTEGKKYLDAVPGSKLKMAFKEMSIYVRNLPTELKIRLLNCLMRLFEIDSNYPDNQVTCLTQSWYENLTETENLNFIMEYCKNPFPDIKRAALGFLKSVCMHKWGQEYLMNSGGLIEYLLDRKTEFDKDVLQDKYEVIVLLSSSSVFEAQTIVEFKRYVAIGAFYKEAITEVAVEGE